MRMVSFLFLAGFLAVAGAACPSFSDGSIDVLGGDGSVVLKDLAVDFSATFESPVTNLSNYDLQVVGDAKGNKLELGTDGVSGILKFKKARRRSAEADAPGRKKNCSPKLPCYGRVEILMTDRVGTCPPASYAFTPMVQTKHAPLIPLVVSVFLGPATRDPIVTLVFAGWLARCMLEGDGWLGSLRYLDTDLLNILMGNSYASLFLFTIMIAGVTGGAIKSGGVEAIGKEIGKIVRNTFLAQLAVYAAGFVFFVDDYANTVIVGSTLKSITDLTRLSREKLAFLVDCTASPIASVMPLSTWIGYEIQLIREEIDRIGYDREAPYTLFLMSIEYRFYSWFMLIFVASIIVFGRDFGPMFWAEKRARETGILFVKRKEGDGSEEEEDQEEEVVPANLVPRKRIPRRIVNGAVPFLLFIVLFFPLLYYSGAKQAAWGGTGWNVGSRTIIGNADAWQTLFWTCGMILLVQLVMYAAQYDQKKWGGCLLSPSQVITSFVNGTNTMYAGLVALLVAFAFAENMKSLLIADYLVDTLGDSLTVQNLPTVTFCLAAAYAFATGSSWGTMAVFFQPSIALAVYLFQDDGDKPDKSLDNKRFTDIMVRTIAAILGGATWGDHCSFVSDTTILSATASGCPLWSHYFTQAPYALLSGVMAILFGFLPAGAGTPAGLCIAFGFVVQPTLIFALSSTHPAFGGTVPVYGPGVGLVDGGLKSNFVTIATPVVAADLITTDKGKKQQGDVVVVVGDNDDPQDDDDVEENKAGDDA